MDITELILRDHDDQRRLFAHLEDIGSADPGALAAVWDRLRNLLEVHADAEEELFYPHLLKVGTGAGGKDSVADEVADVIKDHNQIRDAIAEVAGAEVGGKAWWQAVGKVNEANSDHMGEEEREDLTDFRRHASLQLRHDIAVAFAAFEARHPTGVEPRDRDPRRYVEENS